MEQLGRLEDVYGKQRKAVRRLHGKRRVSPAKEFDSARGKPPRAPSPTKSVQRPILLPTDFLAERKEAKQQTLANALQPESPAPMERTGEVDARMEDFSESDHATHNN